jgi:two-component system nitrogen regulation response regulator GlnG
LSALILIVEDDAAVCWSLEQTLTLSLYRVATANCAAAALKFCKKTVPDLVISDVRMPGESGVELLEHLHQAYPKLPVIVCTAYGSVDIASTAVARGAVEFLPKPLDMERTLTAIERALGRRSLAIEVDPGHEVEPTLIGSAPVMQELFRRIAMAAAGDLPVLISGPTGSGKELVARLLHRHSQRAAGPFVAVNCGALTTASAEQELFGLNNGHQGLITSATGGTLLLDELGDLPLMIQASLLRVLEDHNVRPVGSLSSKIVDIRIIAATNRDLSKNTVFRTDLLHRFTGIMLTLPALIEHVEDIPQIAGHLLARCAGRTGRPLALTDAALAVLMAHDWPGNGRELRQVLEEAVLVAPGRIIDAEHLRINQQGKATFHHPEMYSEIRDLFQQYPGQAYARWMDRMEEPLLTLALEQTKGNQLRAAELLGIHRTTLRKRAQELKIPSE